MNDRPNLLLITTDQQRFDTINAAGNRYLFTPNLNFLHDTGIAFQRAYSDCPLCSPARVTLMTGQSARRHGLGDNSSSVDPVDPSTSLPGRLTQAGYQTRLVGKMHFAKFRCNYGFEHIEPVNDYYREMARHPEKGVPMDHGLGQNVMEPGFSTVAESDSLTHWTVRRSIDFVETRDRTRPFFLWTSFTKPHPPFDPCQNYWELYKDRPMPEAAYGDWSRTPDDVPPELSHFTRMFTNADRFSPEQLADVRRAYYAMITQVDYNLGLLFARLREMNLLQNTWILFCSDHGEMLGDHHLGAKMVPFEASARVPMILVPPLGWKGQQGQTSEALVTLADVFPTFLNLATDSIPQDQIDGIDLLASLEGTVQRDHVIIAHRDLAGMVEGNWKYIRLPKSGRELLFNLKTDPLEQQDLRESSAHAQTLSGLRERFRQRWAEPLPDVRGEGPLTPRNTWLGYHSRSVPSDVLH